MTTDPQAGRRDDDTREHKTIGQRIRDAVLGDPDDTRSDAPASRDPGHANQGYADQGYADTGRDAPGLDDPNRSGVAYDDPNRTSAGYDDRGTSGTGTDDPRQGSVVASFADQDRAGGTATYDDRDRAAGATTYDDRERAAADRGGVDRDVVDRDVVDRGDRGPGFTDTGRGDLDRGDLDRDRDRGLVDPVDVNRDDRDRGDLDRDRGHAARSDDPNRGSALASFADGDRDPAVPGSGDPVRTRTDVGDSAGGDREYSGYEQAMREHVDRGAVPEPGRGDVRQADTGRDVLDRERHGDRSDDVVDRSGSTGTRDDRDFVTSSYDPDRDSGYNPQAAGTAMVDPADLPDRDARTTGVRDQGGHGTRDTGDYDPAADTAYIDEGRADTDRRTGHRDADYDTGRVDTDPATRGGTSPGAGAVAAGGAVAGAAAAAVGAAAAHHRRDSADAGAFSEVDDTSTVDRSATGRATPDRSDALDRSGGSDGSTGAADRAQAVAADDAAEDSGQRERLVPADRAQDYSSRWDALKGDFVDEPRRAVAQADDLVGELLDEIQRLFADQRRDLEQGFDHDRASTEDLRLALRRYRSFFDRLLSF